MKVHVVTAVYPPERVTSALTAKDVVDELASRGHEVTVFTSFPSRPSGRLMEGFARRPVRSDTLGPVRIVRTWHTLSTASTLVSRGLENLSFGSSSTLALCFAGRPDVAYLNTWPIISQNLNALYLAARGIPIVASIQDLYPETLTSKNKLSASGWTAKLMLAADRSFFRRCAAVTTLSEDMRDYLVNNRGLPPDRVFVNYNWMDTTQYSVNLRRVGELRSRFGVGESSFVATFAGSLTMSAGIGIYIDVAALLRSHPEIAVFLVGEGSVREWAVEEIRRRGLSNIHVVSPLLPENVASVLAEADVALLSLTGDAGQSAMPSKLVSYMLSGTPTLASVSQNSAPARIITDHHAGVVVPPDDPQVVADKLLSLMSDRTTLERMGANARTSAFTRFSREAALPKLVALIEKTARRG